MGTANKIAIQRLASVLQSIQDESLEIYNETKHEVKTINLGSGAWLEIHYHPDDEEINEAFFMADGARIALSSAEVDTLSLRF